MYILQNATHTTVIYGLTPEAFYALLGAFIGALIGFLLFAAWDSYKGWQREKRQKDRILTLLAIETAENLLRVDTIQKMMQDEIAISDEGKMYVTTPPRLSMDGWTLAKAENLLKYVTQENLKVWILLYTNMAMMNSNLEGRELFRTTSISLSDYKDRVIEFDKTIIDGSCPLLKRAKDAIESLPNHIRLSLKSTLPEIEIPAPSESLVA